MGERKKDALRVNFNRKLNLEFHGVKVTSDAGLLTFRDRFDILMEIRLSGVAMRLIWEMSVYRNNITLPATTIVRH